MAALTSAELTNISNAALDWYINKGNVMSQTIQEKLMSIFLRSI